MVNNADFRVNKIRLVSGLYSAALCKTQFHLRPARHGLTAWQG